VLTKPTPGRLNGILAALEFWALEPAKCGAT